jgi:hypothetical protein
MFYVRKERVRLTAGVENLGYFLPGSAVLLLFIIPKTVSGRKCGYVFYVYWVMLICYILHSDSKLFGSFKLFVSRIGGSFLKL